MKYELLLKDILKYTKRANIEDEYGYMRDACEVMRVIPKSANDMMDVGRLQRFEVSTATSCERTVTKTVFHSKTG